MKRIKIYNLFIFLSTLARSLIDCFIPIILYNKGLEVKYIISFLLLNYSLGFILNVPLGFIGRKITFKWLLIITSFLIGLSYYYLLMVKLDVTNLFLFTLFHVASTQAYWLSRHYYALEVLPKHNLADDAGNIVVFSTLALVPISYVGALLINNIDIEQVLIIIVLLYMISVIPLFKITEKKKDINRELITTSHNIVLNIPRKSLWFMFIAQFRMVSRYLFPLFLYIYVHQNYEYIGVFNIAVSVASIFFIYFFSKRMDKEKKDYLLLSGVLFCIVYFLKLNIVDT
ncbi:MAG: MFS transporter, partial [Bacilli bacterium]|nr:MFS transporter [Bacilli bacterium]